MPRIGLAGVAERQGPLQSWADQRVVSGQAERAFNKKLGMLAGRQSVSVGLRAERDVD
jgi:hypothetical protein